VLGLAVVEGHAALGVGGLGLPGVAGDAGHGAGEDVPRRAVIEAVRIFHFFELVVARLESVVREIRITVEIAVCLGLRNVLEQPNWLAHQGEDELFSFDHRRYSLRCYDEGGRRGQLDVERRVLDDYRRPVVLAGADLAALDHVPGNFVSQRVLDLFQFVVAGRELQLGVVVFRLSSEVTLEDCESGELEVDVDELFLRSHLVALSGCYSKQLGILSESAKFVNISNKISEKHEIPPWQFYLSMIK